MAKKKCKKNKTTIKQLKAKLNKYAKGGYIPKYGGGGVNNQFGAQVGTGDLWGDRMNQQQMLPQTNNIQMDPNQMQNGIGGDFGAMQSDPQLIGGQSSFDWQGAADMGNNMSQSSQQGAWEGGINNAGYAGITTAANLASGIIEGSDSNQYNQQFSTIGASAGGSAAGSVGGAAGSAGASLLGTVGTAATALAGAEDFTEEGVNLEGQGESSKGAISVAGQGGVDIMGTATDQIADDDWIGAGLSFMGGSTYAALDDYRGEQEEANALKKVNDKRKLTQKVSARNDMEMVGTTNPTLTYPVGGVTGSADSTGRHIVKTYGNLNNTWSKDSNFTAGEVQRYEKPMYVGYSGDTSGTMGGQAILGNTTFSQDSTAGPRANFYRSYKDNKSGTDYQIPVFDTDTYNKYFPDSTDAKYPDGGITKPIDNINANEDPQAAYYQNWLNNRRGQLAENMQYSNSGRPLNEMYHSITGKDREWINEEFYRQKNNIDDTKYSIAPVTELGDSAGEYSSAKKEIKVRGNQDNTSTEVHERTHSAKPYPQEAKIKDMTDKGYINSINQDQYEKKDYKYLTDPKEINARLMELRYNNKIDPNINPTLEDVKKYRKVSKDNDLFEIYSDEDIQKLLKEVAVNNKQNKNDIMIAANGGRSNMMSDGNPNAELETKEVFRTPDGEIEKVPEGTPSHANGGIKLSLPEGTEILGKMKGKFNNKEYKELGQDIKRRYDKYDKIVNDTNASLLGKNTARKMLDKVQAEFDTLMTEQEVQKNMGKFHPTVKDDPSNPGQLMPTQESEYTDPNMYAKGGKIPKYYKGTPGTVDYMDNRPAVVSNNGALNPFYNDFEEAFGVPAGTGYSTMQDKPGIENSVLSNDNYDKIFEGRDGFNSGDLRSSYQIKSDNPWWKDSGTYGKAAQMLPAAYNIGMGIFGKADKSKLNAGDYRNPYAGQIQRDLGDMRYNIKPQLDMNELAYQSGKRNIRQLAPGTGGALSNYNALSASRMRADGQAWATKQNMENQYRGQRAGIYGQLGAQEANTKLGVDQYNQSYNAQAKGAKQQFLSTGLDQVAGSVANMGKENNQQLSDAELRKMYNAYMRGERYFA